jgi:apolipoprotein N-acyltransferase
VLAYGWRRAAIAVAAGAASTLALAPINAWPILFVTFPIVVLLLDGALAGRLSGTLAAAVVGWWFGLGYFLTGLYWIGFAFLVDATNFGFLMPFAVVALPAGLAVFTAAGFALARALWTPGQIRILTLALALTAAEWLRGHVLTGFPWNAYGYALTGPLALAQSSALLGLWGQTFLAVLLFASPAVLFDDPKNRRRWLLPGAASAALAALAGYGELRLAHTPTHFVPGVKLRIMQPNLPQDAKFNYAAKQQVMDRYVALSSRPSGVDSPGGTEVTHLIWPESAFPFFLAREPEMLAQIAPLVAHRILITGAVRAAPSTAAGNVRAYNSIYVLDRNAGILSFYDKVHLVPFGEYLPLQNVLESLGLMQLTKMPGGFLPGDQRRPMIVPGAPSMLPLICYEIVFPDEAVASGERPGFIINLTNDGWFGDSIGPYQHFQQARVRAIEQGLPLVRAANTGISAVIDPLGRVLTRLPLGAEGVLDAPLPQSIAPTFFARFGNAPLELVLGASLIVVMRRRSQQV